MIFIYESKLKTFQMIIISLWLSHIFWFLRGCFPTQSSCFYWPSTNQPWPRSRVRNLREVPGRAVPWPAPPAAWPRCTAMSPRHCQGWFVPAWALPLEARGFGGWGRGGSWVDFLVDMDMLWGTVLLLGMIYWCLTDASWCFFKYLLVVDAVTLSWRHIISSCAAHWFWASSLGTGMARLVPWWSPVVAPQLQGKFWTHFEFFFFEHCSPI